MIAITSSGGSTCWVSESNWSRIQAWQNQEQEGDGWVLMPAELTLGGPRPPRITCQVPVYDSRSPDKHWKSV